MDTRFVRVWENARERRTQGEPFDRILASMSSEELVEALAGAGHSDPVAANVIATVVLNRLHRARLLGALLGTSLLSLVGGLVLLSVDRALTGTIGVLESKPVGLDVGAIGIAGIVVACMLLLATWAAWQRLRGPRR